MFFDLLLDQEVYVQTKLFHFLSILPHFECNPSYPCQQTKPSLNPNKLVQLHVQGEPSGLRLPFIAIELRVQHIKSVGAGGIVENCNLSLQTLALPASLISLAQL